MKINFFGDFVAPDCSKLELSDEIHTLIAKADINIVNFEAASISDGTILSSRIKKSGPSLHQDSLSPKWIEDNGFTLVSLANNHILDYGDEGLSATKVSFKINTFGAGDWADAYRPYITTINEKKIAFLAFTHCEFGTLTDRWDRRFNNGAAWINHPDVDSIIISTRNAVDYLFVFAHAGVENITQPLPEWRDRYRAFIDLGCDGVIASHPHIIQGWEKYNGKPIVYSLGNFYFPKKIKKPDSWYKSLCVTLTVNDSIDIEITPLQFHDNIIYVDKSMQTSNELIEVNRVLTDDILYMDYINNICLQMLDVYDDLFEYGGYVKGNFKRVLKFILRQAAGRNRIDSVHLINNLRCESHRFCISRGLKLRDNIR